MALEKIRSCFALVSYVLCRACQAHYIRTRDSLPRPLHMWMWMHVVQFTLTHKVGDRCPIESLFYPVAKQGSEK